METNHDITNNDLLSLVGYTALVPTFLLVVFISLIISQHILAIVFFILSIGAAKRGDNKHEEIQEKLGLK